MTEAEKQCRTAWAAAPDAKFAWCCHHAVLIEPLTEPATARIDYIRDCKPEHEQERRFNNFRPVLSPSLALEQAATAHNHALAVYDQTLAVYDQAGMACYQARRARDRALAAYICSPKCEEDHLRDVPGHTWNGTDIF